MKEEINMVENSKKLELINQNAACFGNKSKLDIPIGNLLKKKDKAQTYKIRKGK